MHGEVDHDHLGLGAVLIDLDVEHAGADAVGVDGAHLDGGVEQGDIFTLASDAGDGVGGHVMTGVLEVGYERKRFASGEAFGPVGATVVEDGLACGDEHLAAPGLTAIGHLDIDLEARAVFNTLCYDEAECILQGDGLLGRQHTKLSGALGEGQALVGASQVDVGVAVSRVNADVLEDHGEARLLVDRSEVGRVVGDGDEGAFGRKDGDTQDFSHFVVADHSQGGITHIGHRGEAKGAGAVDDVARGNHFAIHHQGGDAVSGVLGGDFQFAHAEHQHFGRASNIHAAGVVGADQQARVAKEDPSVVGGTIVARSGIEDIHITVQGSAAEGVAEEVSASPSGEDVDHFVLAVHGRRPRL